MPMRWYIGMSIGLFMCIYILSPYCVTDTLLGNTEKWKRQVACPHEADIGPRGLSTQQKGFKI